MICQKKKRHNTAIVMNIYMIIILEWRRVLTSRYISGIVCRNVVILSLLRTRYIQGVGRIPLRAMDVGSYFHGHCQLFSVLFIIHFRSYPWKGKQWKCLRRSYFAPCDFCLSFFIRTGTLIRICNIIMSTVVRSCYGLKEELREWPSKTFMAISVWVFD